MSSRTAIVLETNPVITERYLEYTSDSDWRIMLKDTLNDFLEKLQKENFNLVVAEESLLPDGIIQMMKSIGVPFLLSSNTKNPEIPTLPRNFNRTELLTVFNRLVPDMNEEPAPQDTPKDDGAAKELFSGLEDEETFELTSDAVISEPGKPNDVKNDAEDSLSDFFGESEFLSDETENTAKPTVNQTQEDEITLKTAIETDDSNETDALFSDIPDNKEEPADEFKLYETTEMTQNPLQNAVPAEEEKTETPAAEETAPESEESAKTGETETAGNTGTLDDALKTEISAWLEKNARSIIKEIVFEQLTSISGKNDD